MLNKKQRLLREYYGRVHDMCEGTNVKPRNCVKVSGDLWTIQDDPSFADVNSDYEFAISIINDKAVFADEDEKMLLKYFSKLPDSGKTAISAVARHLANKD